jgi:hypothetical protein
MTDEIRGWFAGRVPDGWFIEPIEVTADRDEVLVVGRLATPDLEEGASDDSVTAAEHARIDGYRSDTREQRIRIARDAEARFGRKVSWGARCGDTGVLFTHLAIPTMTRLRLKERAVLDTLIDSGVARSRSDAVAWCVRLVAKNQDEWLDELRDALSSVKEVRDRGPE